MSRRCLSCHQLPLKSSANSIPKPMPAHTSHPPVQEELQQWAQAGQNHAWCQHLSAQASTPSPTALGIPTDGSWHATRCWWFLTLPPPKPNASRSNLLPSPGSSARLPHADTGLDHSETGPMSFSVLLPAGFCGELGPPVSRVPAGEGTSFPPRGFEAPAPITGIARRSC